MFLNSFLYKRLISLKGKVGRWTDGVCPEGSESSPQAVPLGPSGASKANSVPSPFLYRFCPSSCSHLCEHTDVCSASQSGSQGVLAPAHTSCWCHLLHGFQSLSPSSRAAMARRHRQGGSRTAKSNFLLGQVARRPKLRGSWGWFLWGVLRDNCSRSFPRSV